MKGQRWLSRTHKRSLHGFADLYNQIFENMIDLTDEQLDALKKAALSCRTTNCSAAEYRVGQILLPEIGHEQARRKRFKLKDGK